MATPDIQIAGLKRQLALIDADLAKHHKQMKDLDYFVNHNRFDRNSTREAEEEISLLHTEINALNARRAPLAAKLVALEMAGMQEEYDALARRAGEIEARMDNVQINLMDAQYRSPELMASSKRDYLHYQEQYRLTVHRMGDLMRKMRQRQGK